MFSFLLVSLILQAATCVCVQSQTCQDYSRWASVHEKKTKDFAREGSGHLTFDLVFFFFFFLWGGFRNVSIDPGQMGLNETRSWMQLAKQSLQTQLRRLMLTLTQYDIPQQYDIVKYIQTRPCVCWGGRLTRTASSLIVVSSHIWLWLIWGLTATHWEDSYNARSQQDYEGFESTQLNKGHLETLIQLTSFCLLTPPITVTRAAFRTMCLFGSTECPLWLLSSKDPWHQYPFSQKNNRVFCYFISFHLCSITPRVPLIGDKAKAI